MSDNLIINEHIIERTSKIVDDYIFDIEQGILKIFRTTESPSEAIIIEMVRMWMDLLKKQLIYWHNLDQNDVYGVGKDKEQ